MKEINLQICIFFRVFLSGAKPSEAEETIDEEFNLRAVFEFCSCCWVYLPLTFEFWEG